jgi:hypothetical protein
MRKWGDFTVTRDRERLIIAGVLLEDLPVMLEEAFYFFIHPQLGEAAFLVEQRSGRGSCLCGLSGR